MKNHLPVNLIELIKELSDTLEKIPEDRRDDAVIYFDTKESTRIWGENELTFKARF